MEKFHRFLRSFLIFLAGVIVGLAGFRWLVMHRSAPPASVPAVKNESPLGQTRFVGDFSFTDIDGKKVSRADLKGKVWVADFFFTRCLGPCPLLTNTMAKLQDEFSGKKDFRFVSFTVDPDFDTASVLRHYAESYKADKSRWFFLTGDKSKMYKMIQDSFQLAVGPDEQDPIQVVHSLSLVLVGQNSEILGYYNTSDPEALAQLRAQLTRLN